MMRLPAAGLALLTSLWLSACGSSSNPSGPGALGPQGVEVRVMTFNIQHGLTGAGRYDLQAAIDVIAKLNPDLVGIQELTRNHPFYNCDDQPARIAAGLSAATGRSWTAAYQQEWTTQIRDCPNSGRGDGPATEGLGFFVPGPMPSTSHTALWNGRIGHLATLSPGRDFAVINTHLAQGVAGQSNANQGDRMRQLDALLPWSLSRPSSGARVLMGDMNFNPSTTEYARVREGYRDAWEDALAAGTARGRMDGITHRSSRIDYIFYVPATGVELLWVETVDTRALTGIEASDHQPLVAAFRIIP